VGSLERKKRSDKGSAKADDSLVELVKAHLIALPHQSCRTIALLGAPGFDRKIKHYELVGCDVSLFHEYATPRADELKQILELRWRNEAVTVDDAAISVIEEVTRSNIQKALNVQAEIERVRKINSISIISPEIVQAASASLLLDMPQRAKQ